MMASSNQTRLPMELTYFQAQHIFNSQRFRDAVLAYRRDPYVDDLTYRRAEMFIHAEHILSQNTVQEIADVLFS